MKSTQDVVVDKSSGAFSQSYTTGHTHLFGHNFGSRGDDFHASVSANDRSITVNMKGETASKLFPFMIDYDLRVTYDRASGGSSVFGNHDGYPSYVISVDGHGLMAFLGPPILRKRPPFDLLAFFGPHSE
jgi:hypothetical protein